MRRVTEQQLGIQKWTLSVGLPDYRHQCGDDFKLTGAGPARASGYDSVDDHVEPWRSGEVSTRAPAFDA